MAEAAILQARDGRSDRIIYECDCASAAPYDGSIGRVSAPLALSSLDFTGMKDSHDLPLRAEFGQRDLDHTAIRRRTRAHVRVNRSLRRSD